MASSRVAIFAATLAILSCPVATGAVAEGPKSLSSDLKDAGGVPLGTVTMTDAPRGILIRIEAEGLPAGWHGAHLHERGDCSGPKFEKAGSHVHRGAGLVHGLLNPEANDAGDLPNIHVGADGSAAVELYSTLSSLGGGDDGALLADADGFALVIHAAPDDYASQPIGGTGARIACAAFNLRGL
ncbi:superoxide dismutase family protein [Dongia sp.]|uniref:superoxide dismutase family protein n=1 Tax=Dongia sp. TaxID=1977262 RepID=UPI0035B3FD9D